jgi:hypothetical protein
MEMSVQLHAEAALPPEKIPYPLDKRLFEPRTCRHAVGKR